MALSAVPTGSVPFLPGLLPPETLLMGQGREPIQDIVELSPEVRMRRLQQRGDSVTQIAFKTGLDPLTVKIDLRF